MKNKDSLFLLIPLIIVLLFCKYGLVAITLIIIYLISEEKVKKKEDSIKIAYKNYKKETGYFYLDYETYRNNFYERNEDGEWKIRTCTNERREH